MATLNVMYIHHMVEVQRVAPCGGGESLNVKPQANGGRKIHPLYYIQSDDVLSTSCESMSRCLTPGFDLRTNLKIMSNNY